MTDLIPAANRTVDRGDNLASDAEKIDYAKIETERLNKEYAGLWATFARLKTEAEAIPDRIDDDATALKAGGVIKALRDLRSQMENTRKVEGEPHLRRKNAVDATFGERTEAIQPEEKKKRLNDPGLIDVAQNKINGHQDRKEAAERARLERLRQEQERIERDAREKAEREARLAREAEEAAQRAREAADRARSEEGRKAREEEARLANEESARRAAVAKQAEVEASQAVEKKQDADIATLAKSADVVRTQGTTAEGGGVTLTKATEKFAHVVDRAEFDDKTKALLFEYLTDTEVEKTVRAFANATRYLQTLPGCAIGTRKKGVTR